MTVFILQPPLEPGENQAGGGVGGAGGTQVTLSLLSEDLHELSPGPFLLAADRKVNTDPQPACSWSGLGEAYVGINWSTLRRSNVSWQDQLVPPGGL